MSNHNHTRVGDCDKVGRIYSPIYAILMILLPERDYIESGLRVAPRWHAQVPPYNSHITNTSREKKVACLFAGIYSRIHEKIADEAGLVPTK